MMGKRWLLALMFFVVVACQPETPAPPISARLGGEFTLAPGQSGVIDDVGLTITLISVPADQRCPLEVECTESGPVTVGISLQKDAAEPVEFSLQAFTDSNGQTPDGPFEGIQDRVEFEGFEIRVRGILPHPVSFEDPLKLEDYQVLFVVGEK